MEKLNIIQYARMKDKFASYPPEINQKLQHLRDLIMQTATEIKSVTKIEETLKWGEPSYLTKKGSTVRIDWKAKSPDQYAIYFKCTSKLVLTFREVYGDQFNYENNRAIVFKMDDTVPDKMLKECIKLALIYHDVKDMPLLGKTSSKG